MAKCVCKDGAGHAMAEHVRTNCAPSVPVSLLPTLYMIVNQVTAPSPTHENLACARVLDWVKADIGDSMTTWFDHQYKALDALGGSIEYATATFDSKAGRCLDYQNDPHVVVIVPQPIDYFARCSGTSRCKLVCASEWNAFQGSMRSTLTTTSTLDVTMESLFFPGELDADLVLTSAAASVELASSLGKCLIRPQGMPDYSLAVAETGSMGVSVTFWCAPQNAASPVYRSDSSGFGPTAIPGAVQSVQFGDATGEWLAVLAKADGEDHKIFILTRTALVSTPALASTLDSYYVLMRVENMWVLEGAILVDLVTRHMVSDKNTDTGHQTARSEAEAVHVFLTPYPAGLNGSSPAAGRNGWTRTSTDLMQFGGGQYWYTKLGGVAYAPGDKRQYLFLPKVAGMQPYRLWFTFQYGRLVMDEPRPMAPARLSALSNTVLAANSQSSRYVFATSTAGWDWLKQIRLSDGAFVEGVFGSADVKVTVNVTGNCNDRSCEGCTSVQTQRLCLAYNRCALINCVGTPVHQRRPLCGIGALLRHNGGMALHASQGAWAIFSEMLGLTMQLSLLSLREARLLWPEDQFLCYVCQAKDRSAEFFSILTATVNSALQLSDSHVGFMFGGASNVDTNADAVLTISSTALNAFLHQIALLPLYSMAIFHKIVMCEVSGVIALMDSSGFKISLKPAGEASPSDLIAGRCLTAGAETMVNYPRDSPSSLGVTITSLASNAVQKLFLMQIDPFLHMLDGGIAYSIGVVQSFGVLLMAQNAARCNPPDFHLKDVVNCACDDHRLQIPPARATETAKDSALWCTGILGMIDSANQPYYVYNKYTYAQLQAKSAGLADYTKCVTSSNLQQGGGYKCSVPNEPWFSAQGVSTINVLVKCRENYMRKRWDPSAYMLFQPASWNLLKLADGQVPQRPPAAGDAYGVGACLEGGDASRGAAMVAECMTLYLKSRDIEFDRYWLYERTSTAKAGPEYTDACLAFTGPGEVRNISQFAACVDGAASSGATTGCVHPQHLWTPLSDNNIPTAEQHKVASYGANMDGLVQRMYQSARDKVQAAVNASLAVWETGTGTDAVDVEFFSVEGDVLHQTMDCIFMGPYSRVDYWPIPFCQPGEECLNGPFWSRDESAGASRNVDPATCEAPVSLPYTCGSPARKSLMRYLIKSILGGDGKGAKNQNISVIRNILRETLHVIRSDWSDVRLFGCDCGPGYTNATGPYAPSCCKAPGVPLLSQHLNKTFTLLNSTTVLRALESGMSQLYDNAMESVRVWLLYLADVAPAEQASYDWSDSQRVEDEARFNPVNPTQTYSSSSGSGEAMSPLAEEDSTLWDVCHATLKQVFFTLPLDSAGHTIRDDDDPDGLGAFDGDPAKLEAFVRRFTRNAFESSPLFWHYSPRHAPSPSHMCVQDDEPQQEGGDGSVTFTDFRQAGELVLEGTDLIDTIPAFHPQRFRVGARTKCVCGWEMMVQEEACLIPDRDGTSDSVCSPSTGVTCTNLGGLGLTYAPAQRSLVEAAFNETWYCPEYELSPSWGFTDDAAAEAWLAQNTTTLVTSSRDLLQHGRAGLRIANLERLPRLVKEWVHPGARKAPLSHYGLTTCESPPPPASLVDAFVDELFPAAQAVEEGAATAYCLRFTIELARLHALELLSLPELQGPISAQWDVMRIWRRRCGAQLHLLHLCTSLNIYRPLTMPRANPGLTCPFFQYVEPGYSSATAASRRVVYVTTQCLVSVDGVFYDPCRCLQCGGNQTKFNLNLATIEGLGEACRLRFDPRSVLNTGVPIGWTDGVHPLGTDAASSLLNGDAFLGRVWEDADAVGNVETGALWWDAEGPMRANSEFCDGVLDWWDEAWDFPVGYHVTVPCEAEDAAYRSFAQAFALDDSTNTLVYQHDLLREATLADSHFGVGGLCRSGNVGMPMPETNNVRYCTRMPVDDTEDFTLDASGASDPTDSAGYTQWKCASSSRNLPWPDAASQPEMRYQSARFSVGTVPNMPPQNSGTYPATENEMVDLGPWQEISAGADPWGVQSDQLCQDYTLRTCLLDTECPVQYKCRGRVCSNDKARPCTLDSNCGANGVCQGVCMDQLLVECIMHSDCADPDTMCSGIGTCEPAVLAVQNRLELQGDAIQLSLAVGPGGACGPSASAYSLLEGSYWGNTAQDLLRAHGMCSFEDWFKYTSNYAQSGCSVLQADGTLLANPSQCVVSDLEQIDSNQTRWWPAGKARPEFLYLRPTTCDRDYERLQDFVQCAPKVGGSAYLLRDTLADYALEYDEFVRLHDDRTRLRLAAMPERTSLSTGFLGLGGVVREIKELDASRDPGPFVSCGSIGQCYPSDFFVNGVNLKTNRSYYTASSNKWTAYPPRTPFVCGVFGVEGPGGEGCRLDTHVLPLYRLLCQEPVVASCLALDEASIVQLCAEIPYTYEPSPTDRSKVLAGLRALFGIFPQFKTLDEYLQLTTCANELHAQLKAYAVWAAGSSVRASTGLYYPFMYSLYEFPLDWFFQCVMLSGARVQTNTRQSQDCLAFSTRSIHSIQAYTPRSPASGDSFATYLRFVVGGYTVPAYQAYNDEHAAKVIETMELAKEDVRNRMFPGAPNGPDLSYPRCSKNLLWKIGPHGKIMEGQGFSELLRAIVWNWDDPQTCQQNWQRRLIKNAESYGVTDENWASELTYPDENNMQKQFGSGAITMLDHVIQHMNRRMGIIKLDAVSSQSLGCIRYVNRPPAVYDYATDPVPPSLVPRVIPEALDLMGTPEMDETVNRTCVFPFMYDPKFQRILTTPACGQEVTTEYKELGGRVDRLTTCGRETCTSVPVAYLRDGLFACRYKAEAVIPRGCSETNSDCHTEVLKAVYDAVYTAYVSRLDATPPPVSAPTLFPLFQRDQNWTFNSFNLKEVLDYEQNIQPNPERTVMCEISTSAEQSIKFSSCNNPHYLKLQEHVDKFYKRKGGVSIPAGAQLEWPIGRAALAKGILLSYSNMNKSIGRRYVDALFDDSTACKGDSRLQVCRKDNTTSTKFRSVNPWMLGMFNPYEVCDVDYTDQGDGGREYIYSDCIKEGNSACQKFNAREIPIKCKLDHRRLVTRPGVPRKLYGEPFEYNLCHHQLQEDSEGCMHDQGLLGGFDGAPVGSPKETLETMLAGYPQYAATEKYTVAPNLYENSTWSIPADFKAGIFANANPLWRGDFAPYGYLQINESDIGGHRIGVVVLRVNGTDDMFSTMLVEQIAFGLQEDGKYVNDRDKSPLAGRPVSEWVAALQADMRKDDLELRGTYAISYTPNQLGASCPLKRWMFYAGNNSDFSPTIPSPQRARHLFHRIHGGLTAHPTMRRAPKGEFLGKYKTSNGFCACPFMKDTPQSQCLVPASSRDACSLFSTIEALRADGQEFSSHVFPPLDSSWTARVCHMSLDWPALNGTLRDGSSLGGDFSKASDIGNRECHILDRFRPFQYRYDASEGLTLHAAETLNTASDGVCQTRRLVTLDPAVIPSGYTRCLRLVTTDTEVQFTCNVTTSGNPPVMPRRTRLSADALHRRRRAGRTACSKCAPPPSFESQARAPIPSESSFGVLHRVSPERLLAKDLRDAICRENASVCTRLLNTSAWRRKEFMRNFLHSPHRLFLPQPQGGLTQAIDPPTPEPASRWGAKPWVYCPSAAALRTGEGCHGAISREVWARSKTSICPQMIRSLSTTVTNTSDGDPMARTAFCTVDNTTDAVCLAVFEAREIVKQANCIARGVLDCMPNPFVYHPASYDPSNNAWVHDSVRAFYTRFDPAACPLETSAEQQALLNFARTYQRGCPANAVNLVVAILQVVRVVATEVALVLSTLVGIAIKSMALFLPARAADMRQYIATDWQYVRTKARTMLDMTGDLLVDAMLNSGELGAQIMAFLHRACIRINEAIAWFLNVWCNYIQQYMIQVLAGLRHAMGIMGAGFDMLQDFVDEIFQGILPASFVAKYAQNGFKDSLIESYSRPTDRRDKVKAGLNVPTSVNARPASRLSRTKNVVNKVLGSVTKVAKGPAGKAFMFLSTALTTYEAINGIIGIIEEENLRKLWPENFTLFDLSGVVDALDDMENFLLLDDSCYEFQLSQRQGSSYNKFPCLNLNISQYAATTQGTTSLVSTQCWANAQPLLGQNSLFACSAASTCCRTSECIENILCASCTDPQLPGVAKYGCDSLRQRCVCGLTRLVYDRCSANRQCGLTSQCELVSSLNSISYGTLPCASCPQSARVMCLLPSSGFPGRCSCMLDSVKGYDLCSDLTGTKTSVTGSRLCAYLHGKLRPNTWVFDMEDLVTLPCSQVKTGVCSTVMLGDSLGTVQMVVAESILISASSASSGRRRLLVDDTDDPEQVAPEPGPPTYDAYESEYELSDSQALHLLLTAPGWNTTSAPCSLLALAYQEPETQGRLGLLETHVLHKCGFWRYVGRRVIQRYNLTGAMDGHETFLLSLDDLVYALMTPGIALALIRNPGVFASAALYHPWLKPVRAFGVLLANQLEQMKWLQDVDTELRDVLFGGTTADEEFEPPLSRPAPAPLPRRHGRRSGAGPEQHAHDADADADADDDDDEPPLPLLSTTGGRRLLTVQESIQAVVPVQASPGVQVLWQGAAPQNAPGLAAVNSAGAWSSSAYSWPPRYDYSLKSCPLGQSIMHIAMQALSVNRLYYQNFNRPRPAIDRSLRANLPSWTWIDNITSRVLASPASGQQQQVARSWASWVFHGIMDALAISPAHLIAFFTDDRKWTLQWILQTSVQCDLAAVITCSRHDKDLLMSTVVFILLYLVIATVGGALGMGFLSTMFLLSYPWFILWYAFGMAPSCFPMIPPCLMGDVIATVEMLVPRAITLPQNLLCAAGPLVNQTCLRPCSDINFTSWVDPLAFAICDTDPRTCAYMRTLSWFGEPFTDTLLWKPFQESLGKFHTIVQSGDLSGHRLCTWVSFITVVPVLAAVIGLLVLAAALATALLDLFPALVTFISQLHVFYET